MSNITDKTLQGTQTGSKTTERIFRGSKKRRARWKLVSFFLALAVVVLCLLTLTVGNTFYSLPEVFRVLTAGGGTDAMRFTILTLRLPRMICGLLAGLSFGVAGYLFQTILRNPLASPDIIGISSATSTAAVFCLLILNLPNSVVCAIAVLAGLLVTLLIYLLSLTYPVASHGGSHARDSGWGRCWSSTRRYFVSYSQTSCFGTGIYSGASHLNL
ncbi:MAG: iron chelate uptake ABC transporter family permease subunit [Firmicutes bacterium]|nr:iron chelate uptake ABC transporter family permease subunit [Bacillota bacterium]